MVGMILKGVGAVVAILVLVVLGWKAFLFDEAALREEIRRQAAAQGYNLQIQQPLQVSLLPQPELMLDGVVLEGATLQPVEVNALELKLAWAPLLSKKLEVTHFEAVVDGARWVGSVALQPRGSAGVVRFMLEGEQLDLDRYLPKSAGQEVADPVAGSAAGIVQLPLQPLRELDLEGEIKIGVLRVAGAEVTKVATRFHAKDGVISVGPMDAALYQGGYQGTMQADVRTDTPQVVVEETLQGVALAPLLQAVAELDVLRGRLELSGKFSSSGTDPKILLEQLNGDASIAVTEGVLVGINLTESIAQARALIQGKPVPPSREPKETPFRDLQASIRIEQGRINSRDMKMESGGMVLSGSGWLELATQKIDYRMVAKVNESLTAEQQRLLGDLAGRSFPVEIRGTLTHPEPNVDLEEILKRGLEQKLKEKVGNKLQQLMGQPSRQEGGGNDSRQQLDKFLKKLF